MGRVCVSSSRDLFHTRGHKQAGAAFGGMSDRAGRATDRKHVNRTMQQPLPRLIRMTSQSKLLIERGYLHGESKSRSKREEGNIGAVRSLGCWWVGSGWSGHLRELGELPAWRSRSKCSAQLKGRQMDATARILYYAYAAARAGTMYPALHHCCACDEGNKVSAILCGPPFPIDQGECGRRNRVQVGESSQKKGHPSGLIP